MRSKSPKVYGRQEDAESVNRAIGDHNYLEPCAPAGFSTARCAWFSRKVTFLTAHPRCGYRGPCRAVVLEWQSTRADLRGDTPTGGPTAYPKEDLEGRAADPPP